MTRLKAILKWTAISLGALVLLVVGAVFALQNTTYDAPYPDIAASSDSAVVQRGSHLVNGPAHCIDCHTSKDAHGKRAAGEPVVLMGGTEFVLPIGIIRTPNLTSDKETGIGSLKDGEIARALRYGVDHNGHALFNFMPFHNLSDEDLRAVISYLRTLPPVRHEVVRREFNFAGKAVNAFVIKPVGPDGTPPKTTTPDSTAQYGKYLALSVANCVGCHTNRDLMTGAFIGRPFAGGFVMESDRIPGITFTTPNITPDPETGHIVQWSEDDFISRFRTGAIEAGTVMPWDAFQNMSDMELKAIYHYLRTVEPVHNEIKNIVSKKEG